VLRVVIDDADEPDAESYQRIPPLINDPVEILGFQATHEVPGTRGVRVQVGGSGVRSAVLDAADFTELARAI
jgi:hypothetical protein